MRSCLGVLFPTVMGFFITVFSLASYANDALGLSQTKAAALQSILSAGQMLGRPLVGLGLDYAGRINTTIVIHILTGLSCFAFWLPARSFGLLIVFALTTGALGGTVWGATPPIAQSVIGTQHLASALGVYWVVVAAPACLANPIAIALLDKLQGSAPERTAATYQASIALCGGCFIAAGIVCLGAKRYVQGSWRILQKA
jgi:MFS family permease